MYLIADSGSTKTEWCITNGTTFNKIITTNGINPVLQKEEEICHILHAELITQIHSEKEDIDHIYFYGAGCTQENIPVVTSALNKVFSHTGTVFVGSDLLGAAHALCGNTPGVVCILGTGANSCLYNGKEIIEHVSPLGFILGDEGSGAYIGKRLVSDVLKNQLPKDLCELFMEQTQLTTATIIRKVYREPMPNRFLASLSKFCYENRNHKAIKELLIDSFDCFFKRNVNQYVYNRKDTHTYYERKANFVGSIAYYYREELHAAANLNGFTLGKIIRNPIEELVKYRIGASSI